MAAGKVLAFGLAVIVAAPVLAYAQGQGVTEGTDPGIQAELTGYEEVPTLSTTGNGSFKAVITKDNEIVYELKYANLESDITQSHIHFGRPAINGGIAAWLCGTPTLPGPAGTPACDGPRDGTVTGTITAASVIGPAGQGISAGEFAELVAAIRAHATYANVHTVLRPGGEIRGIVR
jgi:hypothetical protein